jgi:hypothetical protein
MNNRQYKEYSTWSNFRDSEAFGTEELGNPGVIAFHKVRRDHISKTLLEPYHAAHHMLSKEKIPLLDIVGRYKGSFDFQEQYALEGSEYPEEWLPFHAIQLHILDLDPDDISTACNIQTRKESVVTNPQYVDGDCMRIYLKFLSKEYNYSDIIDRIMDHMREFCYQYGLYIPWFDSQNFLITKLEDWILHITCTDLASDIRDFYEDAEDWIGAYNMTKHQA